MTTRAPSLAYLANELLAQIVEPLDQPDIFAIASTSRSLRAIATLHDNYWFTCKAGGKIGPVGGQLFGDRAEVLATAQLPVGVYIPYEVYATFWPPAISSLERLFSAGLIVQLHITVYGHATELLSLLIRYTAPRLTTLTMRGVRGGYEIPTDLFAGHAPRLWSLGLSEEISLQARSYAALAGTRHVDLRFPTKDLIDIEGLHQVFPNAECLKLALGNTPSAPNTVTAMCKVNELRISVRDVEEVHESSDIAAFFRQLVPNPSVVKFYMPNRPSKLAEFVPSFVNTLLRAGSTSKLPALRLFVGTEGPKEYGPMLQVFTAVDDSATAHCKIQLHVQEDPSYSHPTWPNIAQLAQFIRLFDLQYSYLQLFRNVLPMMSTIEEVRLDTCSEQGDMDHLMDDPPRVQFVELGNDSLHVHLMSAETDMERQSEEHFDGGRSARSRTVKLVLYSTSDDMDHVRQDRLSEILAYIGAIPDFLPLTITLSKGVTVTDRTNHLD